MIACEVLGSKLERNAGPIRGTTWVGGDAVHATVAVTCAVRATRGPIEVTGRIVEDERLVRYRVDQKWAKKGIVTDR